MLLKVFYLAIMLKCEFFTFLYDENPDPSND
jgi:hypothetical protein